jgi:L-aspartate oxidase
MSAHANDSPLGKVMRGPFLVPAVAEQEIRELTWECCGIVRDRAGLESALVTLADTEWVPAASPTLAAVELRNMHQVARLVARAALRREESRGAHYRTDFPEKRDDFRKPSRMSAFPEPVGRP